MRWSPLGWTSIEDIHRIPGVNVLINFCSAKLYNRTYCWVYKKESATKHTSFDDIVTHGNKEMWFHWMEENCLNWPLDLLERCLWVSLSNLMDPYTALSPCSWKRVESKSKRVLEDFTHKHWQDNPLCGANISYSAVLMKTSVESLILACQMTKMWTARLSIWRTRACLVVLNVRGPELIASVTAPQDLH
jgi:hypothetical protein